MVGPENPYVPKDIYPTDTIDFYLFDLAQKEPEEALLACIRRTNSPEEFGLKTAAFLGEFRKEIAPERIKQIVIKLGRQGREGVVMKDPENKVAPLKYTSSETNCSDLTVAFQLLQ